MEENKKALENESSVYNDIITQSQGFVKLSRQILNWERYTDIPCKTVFLHCLLQANYQAKKWMGQIIQPGQFVTSLKRLSEETALSQQQCRTALLKLKSTGELTIKATSRYSIITVNNWDKWQREQHTQQQTSNKQSTTTKEYKEIKNNIYSGQNKNFKKPTIQEVQNYISEIGSSVDAETFMDFYNANGWKINKNPMKDWRAALRNWERRRKEQSQQKREEKEYVYNPYL